MPIVKTFTVGDGDTFYIQHGSDNFTIIDCNLDDDRKEEIVDEIIDMSANKDIPRFISTHPDDDHFKGIEYLDERKTIVNFYCGKNAATKDDETDSFKHYKTLRDGDKAFYLTKDCTRHWMNQSNDERGTCSVCAARPLKPRRISVTPVASQIFASPRIGITRQDPALIPKQTQHQPHHSRINAARSQA